MSMSALRQPAFVPKRRSRHSSTAGLIGFKNENGHAARPLVSKAGRSILQVVVSAPRCPGGRALQELRRVMARLARGRTLGGIAAELRLQLDQFGEDHALGTPLARH